jgi:hypothetical protein
MKEQVQINVETLTQQVNDGMKKPELAKFYGIPVTQMGAALKQAGLKIRKFHAPAFVLVKEEISQNAISQGIDELQIANPVVTEEVEALNSEEVTWNN